MKKHIANVLVAVLLFTSLAILPVLGEEGYSHGAETGDVRYHLDIGVYVVAKVNGKWVNGIASNTVQPYKANLNFPTHIKVKRVMSLAQANNEGINIWNQKYFTNNIPLNNGEPAAKAYFGLYDDYISPNLVAHTIISNNGNNLQFSVDALLKGQYSDYDVMQQYKDRITRTETIQQLVVKDNQTSTAIQNLVAEKNKLLAEMKGINFGGQLNSHEKQVVARYDVVLKQLNALQARPSYKTIDKVIESYKLDEKSFIQEVYKFWGGQEGLKATNPSMYQMMVNMEQGKANLNDEYYLVFIPTVIEYEALKTCDVCGQDRLSDQVADTHCTASSCPHFGTPQCGCYTDPVAQVTPPADTTGSCTDVIKWSEVQSHSYKCSGCKTKTSSSGKKTKYCPGHTCNHVYTYQSKLSSSGTLTAAKPNGNSTTFKSGYGFSVNVNNSIATSQIGNSGACGKSLSKANIKKPVPPSAAEVRTNWTVKLKDSKYTQPKNVALFKGAVTGTTSKFVTAANQLSNYKNAQIYTDVALKGTKQKPIKHTISVYSYGGGVNGVQFCKSLPLTFTINGNMYEDDWTVDGLPR
ncbi:hypothetical protein Ami103574_10665 [Aminipila butyrica]|uniref:Uncharacterized protein n=1 Tax=Aminipila butyrica TaxID=433296 RepID=A0A858BYG9_9FIRM|nr:hypothetical protein [Aminipila butyrica]QIB69754.1 hypothetical protein Ami103574_10665 [Aminipila butyrica]